jgi:hypothetical protein
VRPFPRLARGDGSPSGDGPGASAARNADRTRDTGAAAGLRFRSRAVARFASAFVRSRRARASDGLPRRGPRRRASGRFAQDAVARSPVWRTSLTASSVAVPLTLPEHATARAANDAVGLPMGNDQQEPRPPPLLARLRLASATTEIKGPPRNLRAAPLPRKMRRCCRVVRCIWWYGPGHPASATSRLRLLPLFPPTADVPPSPYPLTVSYLPTGRAKLKSSTSPRQSSRTCFSLSGRSSAISTVAASSISHAASPISRRPLHVIVMPRRASSPSRSSSRVPAALPSGTVQKISNSSPSGSLA